MASRRPRMVNALALATSFACLFVLFTSGAAAVTLPAGFAETTVLPGVGKPQDIAIAPNGRVFVAEKTGSSGPTPASTTRHRRCSPTCARRYTTMARAGSCRSSRTPAFLASRMCTSTTRWMRRSVLLRRYTAAGPSTRARSSSTPRTGTSTRPAADDRRGRQLPGRLAHLAAPGRRRADDRLREGAGRGLLPAVQRPRGRRSCLRQGRQADRVGQRRLHLAVLGLGSVRIAGEPV